MTELQSEILSFFSDKQTIYLATCEGMQPRLRTMTLILMHQRFFMATGSSDEKVKQIIENPLVEILFTLRSENNSGYVRIAGTLNDIKDQPLRKAVADFSGYIYNYWNDSTDPSYKLIELIPQEAQLMLPGDMLARHIIWTQTH